MTQHLMRLEFPPDSVGDAERALLRYAVKLTRQPAAVSKADIETLKLAGLNQRAIHDACQTVAYFNYVNRIADGLGVELERGS